MAITDTINLLSLDDLTIFGTEYNKRNRTSESSYTDFFDMITDIRDKTIYPSIPIYALSRMTFKEADLYRKYGYITIGDIVENYPPLIFVLEYQKKIGEFSDMRLITTIDRLTIESDGYEAFKEENCTAALNTWKEGSLSDADFNILKSRYGGNIDNYPIDKIGLPDYIVEEFKNINVPTIGKFKQLCDDDENFALLSRKDLRSALGFPRLSMGMIKRIIFAFYRAADGNEDYAFFKPIKKKEE